MIQGLLVSYWYKEIFLDLGSNRILIVLILTKHLEGAIFQQYCTSEEVNRGFYDFVRYAIFKVTTSINIQCI